MSLASAELGWTMDKRRLFIGNGSLSEGAAQEGNTEILTEFSPMLDLVRYQYLNWQSDPLSGSLTPGVNCGWQIVRRLQERLDEHVSIKAWGVRGDGDDSPDAVDQETLNFRRAIYEMYMRDPYEAFAGAEQVGMGDWKILHIPAGVYVINRPIPLLRKTMLVGDGSGRTVIIMKNPVDAAMNFVAGTATYQKESATVSFSDYPDDTWLLNRFQFPPVSNSSWSGSTGEVLHVGWPVNDIVINGITFINDDTNLVVQGDVMRIENASNVLFNDCEFRGADYDCSVTPVGRSTLPKCVSISGPSGSGVEIEDKSNHIIFNSCKFFKRGYGVYLHDDIVQVNISDSTFMYLFDGVNVGENLSNINHPVPMPSGETYVWGPRNVQVRNSFFDLVRRYGVAIFTPGLGNGSMYNHFQRTGLPLKIDGSVLESYSDLRSYDYEGVYFYSDPTPGVDGATGNYSIADTFERPDINFDDRSMVGPTTKTGWLYRIGNANTKNTTIDDTTSAKLPRGLTIGGVTFDPMNLDPVSLGPTPNMVPNDVTSITGTNLVFSLADTNSFFIEYSIKRDNNLRIGVIRCITNAVVGGTDASFVFDDDYQETGDIGVAFFFEQGGDTANEIKLRYTMTDGNPAEFVFFTRRWNT